MRYNVTRCPPHQFRCHVARRAGHLAWRRIEHTGQARQPQVEQPQTAVLGEKHIVRLDVAVIDLMPIKCIHGARQTPSDAQPFSKIDRSPQTPLQRLASVVRHHQIQPATPFGLMP